MVGLALLDITFWNWQTIIHSDNRILLIRPIILPNKFLPLHQEEEEETSLSEYGSLMYVVLIGGKGAFSV